MATLAVPDIRSSRQLGAGKTKAPARRECHYAAPKSRNGTNSPSPYPRTAHLLHAIIDQAHCSGSLEQLQGAAA